MKFRKPKAYIIVDGSGTRYHTTDGIFRDLPPANPLDQCQVDLPEDAWIGYRAESEVRLRYAKILDPKSRLEQIDDGE